MRDMSMQMQEGFEAPVIRPVLISYLDILGDSISMWTGPGAFSATGTPDSILNGKVFLSTESFVDASEITEDNGIGGPVSILLKANNINEDALRQMVRDKRRWRGRAAYMWMGLLNEDLNAVYEFPIRIKTGIMTRIVVNRSSSTVNIELTIDEDLQNAKSSPFRLTDHQRIFPEDMFSAFVVGLANKPAGIERPKGTPPLRDLSTDRLITRILGL